MDRKRAAASAAEEAAAQVEKTPSIDSATVIVTPERAKKPRHNEGGDPNSTEKNSTGKREPAAEKDVGGEEEKEQDNSGNNEGEEDGVASAVVVDVFAADKPPEAATSAQLTADSVMGFPMLPRATNREIMTQHIDFVNWAKSKKEKGPVYGRLKDFLEWVESPEGKGFERFTFGQHKGRTFADVALCDPEYHVRYMHALQKHGESPHGELALYIAWFKNTKGAKMNSDQDKKFFQRHEHGNLPF